MRHLLPLICAVPCIAGYHYNIRIATNPASIAADSVNYPLLVSGTFPTLRTVSAGGHVTNTNGYDIVFGVDAACAVPLAFQRESWSGSTGALIAWVGIPALSSTAPTTLYMCYGNAAITTDQENGTAVWDSYYHGRWAFPNGTTLSAADSTSYGLNGTIFSATAAAGEIDGGALLNGTNAYIDMGNSSALDPVSAFTLETWFNPAATWPSPDGAIVGKIDNVSQTQGYMIWYTSGGLLFIYINGAPVYAGSFAPDQWYHLAMTWDGGNYVMYVNGNPTRTYASSTPPASAGQDFRAGEYNSSRLAAGVVDEIRFSSIARPAAWILTEYNNMSAPGSFCTASGENIAPNSTAAGFGYVL